MIFFFHIGVTSWILTLSLVLFFIHVLKFYRVVQNMLKQDAPLMALHGMLNVAPIIPHCMFRRYLKNILPWPLK